MKNLISMAIVGASTFLLLGCSNPLSNTITEANEKFDVEQYPYRYVQSENKETHTSYTLEVAGTKSETIAKNSEVLLADIFSGFKNECGFKKSDLVSINKVRYESPVFYEVWTFHDPLSGREDKKSSMSVVLTAYPNGGGTYISFVGNCHAEPAKLIFSN